MSSVPGLFNYWIAVALMMAGFYVVIAQGNLVKKLVGLGLFQTSVFIFYISIGKVAGGSAPIISDGVSLYSNPLPHVLILTAIVVGVATAAVGLALVVRINERYGSVEESDIDRMDKEAERTAEAATTEKHAEGDR
ncbi:MAG: cation:proton antiporter subunit C [Gammaproteobacteria bacterium]|nr:cation:proton antiporter subunit C [Gammaproteobacteria bacterium]